MAHLTSTFAVLFLITCASSGYKLKTNNKNDEILINVINGDIITELKKANAKISKLEQRMELYRNKTATRIENDERNIEAAIEGILEKMQIDRKKLGLKLKNIEQNIDLNIKGLQNQIAFYHPASTRPPNTTQTQHTTQVSTTTSTMPSTTPSTTTRAPTTTQPLSTTTTTSTTLAPHGPWIYYPPGTKKNKAPKRFEEYGLNFIGFGTFSDKEGYLQKIVYSFGECVHLCVHKREKSGPAWDGLQYRFTGPFYSCLCVRHEQGHIASKSDLHYRFQ